MVNEFEKAQQEKRQDLIEAERPNIDIDEDDSDENVVIEEVEEEPEDKFDCESILTTYSNIYNHPKLISEPRNKVSFYWFEIPIFENTIAIWRIFWQFSVSSKNVGFLSADSAY